MHTVIDGDITDGNAEGKYSFTPFYSLPDNRYLALFLRFIRFYVIKHSFYHTLYKEWAHEGQLLLPYPINDMLEMVWERHAVNGEDA